MKKWSELRHKKPLFLVVFFVAVFGIGLVIGVIFYSNRLTQTMELKGIDGYIDLSIDTALPSLGFRGSTYLTSIKCERINPNFNGLWEVMLVINNTSTNDLIPSDVTGSFNIYEMDHTTSIKTNAFVFIQNNSWIYDSIVVFDTWTDWITQGDVCYIDFSITFASAATEGSIAITTYVRDNT